MTRIVIIPSMERRGKFQVRLEYIGWLQGSVTFAGVISSCASSLLLVWDFLFFSAGFVAVL